MDNLVLGALGTTANNAVGAAAFLEEESVYYWLAKWYIRFLGRINIPSQTASHQTFSTVQAPWQCTPSIWSEPMMAFLRVPPSLMMKTASLSPPSSWPVHSTPRPYVFIPPLKTSVISLGSSKVSLPWESGRGKVYRLVRWPCEPPWTAARALVARREKRMLF